MSNFDESKVRRDRGKFANKDAERDEAGQVELNTDAGPNGWPEPVTDFIRADEHGFVAPVLAEHPEWVAESRQAVYDALSTYYGYTGEDTSPEWRYETSLDRAMRHTSGSMSKKPFDNYDERITDRAWEIRNARDDEEAARLLDETFAIEDTQRPLCDPAYVPVATGTTEGANSLYPTRKGSRYDEGANLSTTEQAAGIRAEVKKAVEAGWLPDTLEYSVTKQTFAGGASIDIRVKGLQDGWATTEAEDYDFGGTRKVETAQGAELHRRVEDIRMMYNRDASNPQVDYFSTNYYGQTAFEEQSYADDGDAATARRLARIKKSRMKH